MFFCIDFVELHGQTAEDFIASSLLLARHCSVFANPFGYVIFLSFCFTLGSAFSCILFMTSRCIQNHTPTRRHWFAPFGMTHQSFSILLQGVYGLNVFMSSCFLYILTPGSVATENILPLRYVIGIRRFCRGDVGFTYSTTLIERAVLEECLGKFSFLVNKIIVSLTGLWSVCLV